MIYIIVRNDNTMTKAWHDWN